jgi:hypothetical protein
MYNVISAVIGKTSKAGKVDKTTVLPRFYKKELMWRQRQRRGCLEILPV